jgi:hypothetical protein
VRWIVALAIVESVACGGEVNAESGATAEGGVRDAGSGMPILPVPGCPRSTSVADAGPGVVACQVGKELFWCHDGSTQGCAWVSDAGPACPLPGASCLNACAADEYALQCGGVPLLRQPGGPVSYQEAPTGCRRTGPSPRVEIATYCCPCE